MTVLLRRRIQRRRHILRRPTVKYNGAVIFNGPPTVEYGGAVKYRGDRRIQRFSLTELLET